MNAKTKFKVDILKEGTENNALLTAIANHNEGKVFVSIPDFISWGVMKTAMYPNVIVSIERDEGDENKLIVNDNGKITLTIEEIEIHELVEVH